MAPDKSSHFRTQLGHEQKTDKEFPAGGSGTRDAWQYLKCRQTEKSYPRQALISQNKYDHQPAPAAIVIHADRQTIVLNRSFGYLQDSATVSPIE